MEVFTSLAVVPPSVNSKPSQGATSLSGSATPSVANGATVNVGLVDDDDFVQAADEKAEGSVKACYSADQADAISSRLLSLNLSSGTSPTSNPTK